MKDEPIYFINQFSILKRPIVWSKKNYWISQLILTAITLPVLIWILIFFNRLPFPTTFAILLASSLGGALGFSKGRKRAERYKVELATIGPNPHYGKYPLEWMLQTRRV